MNSVKTLTTMVVMVALLFRPGCAVITSVPTPGVDATQAAMEEACISREEDSRLTPSHPVRVTVQAIAGTIVLMWLGTGDDRIGYYQIYRKVTDDEHWRPITRVKATGDNEGWYEFRDTAVEWGVTYIYGVSAVDVYGNESTVSESPAITSMSPSTSGEDWP